MEDDSAEEMEVSAEEVIVVNLRLGGWNVTPADALANPGFRMALPLEACKSGRAVAEMMGLSGGSELLVLGDRGRGRGPVWRRLKLEEPPPQIRGEIYILQLLNQEPPKPRVDEAWGSKEAQKVPPSGMSNSMCIKLQAMDKDGNLKDGGLPQLLNFRPAYATPPLPAALAHEAFGNFLDVFKGRKGELDDSDVAFFLKLALKCSRYYNNEAAYKDEVAELWKAYSGFDFINVGGTHVDLGCRHHELKALFAALEAKLGMFGSKSDPGMQGAQYVRFYWLLIGDRDRFGLTCYPALVIEHIGPFVRISAVYCLDQLCFTPLTPFVNLLLLQCHDMPAALEGARLCKATKLALQELSHFYQRPEHGCEQQIRKTLPYPLQHSKYAPTPLAREKLVFRVEGVIFKYVQGPYGEAVHRAWQQAGLAPRLYTVKPLAGGWLEVKMEYLGKDWRLLHGHPQAQELRAEVLKMLDKAHGVPVGGSGVGVHGDARDVNVMVKVGERVEVKFIDFDWAAVQGVGRYPYFMNHVGVNWPTGVSGGQMMLQKHDKELLGLSQGHQTRS